MLAPGATSQLGGFLMRTRQHSALALALTVAVAANVSVHRASAQVAPTSARRGGTFTLDDYAKVARVTGVRISPAGDRAVVVVARPEYDSSTWDADLVLVDLRTKAQRTVTHRKTAASPRWSSSGDRLAFLARGDAGNTQLFVMPADGGEARQVTRAPNGVSSFAWKPDGTTFAYSASPADSSRRKFDDSFVVTANDYLTQSATRPVHLYTISAAGGTPTRVATGAGTLSALGAALVWSPDGRTLTFGVQAGPGSRHYPKRSVAVADVTTGAVSTIPGLEGRWCGAVTPSPDGTALVASCPIDGKVQNPSELLLVPSKGGAPRALTTLDRDLSRGVWSPDSRYVVVSAPDSLASGLWEIPLTGSPRRRHVGRLTVGELDVARDGTIAFIATAPQRPPEVYVVRPGADVAERITDIHAEVVALTLGMSETLTWQSDGYAVSGVLTFPPDFDPSRTYPVLLDIHGGPWASSLERFAAQTQLFAAQGWIIFEPNYRGSDNMGKAFYTAVYRDHGAGPGRDVMAGLTLLKRRAYVDTTRIGISGWSYGGYMTTWLIGHYPGWKAAMAGAAVIDLVDDYNLNDLSLYLRAFGETLSFADDLALMKEQSPLTYVDQMTTPLLLHSDAGDVRVPVTQSYNQYHALKERGRDVQMRLWPVAGHFPSDPYRARDIDQKWMEFFKERLK
jgi:dipeptidyl aminopeptidase/acylaminoacyl peptidase